MNRHILFRFNFYDVFLRFSSFSRSRVPLIIFYVTDSLAYCCTVSTCNFAERNTLNKSCKFKNILRVPIIFLKIITRMEKIFLLTTRAFVLFIFFFFCRHMVPPPIAKNPISATLYSIVWKTR